MRTLPPVEEKIRLAIRDARAKDQATGLWPPTRAGGTTNTRFSRTKYHLPAFKETSLIPIYEQGGGRGIGHGFESFERRFEEICRSHSDQSFAFIFYDFRDAALRTILKDQGVFAKLDRLSGDTLSIFYLHSGGAIIERFNDTFTKAIGLTGARIPCVAFFRWTENGFTDVHAVPLENTDLIHGFNELYSVVEDYIKKKPVAAGRLRYLRWMPGAIKFLSLEALRAALRAGFGHFM